MLLSVPPISKLGSSVACSKSSRGVAQCNSSGSRATKVSASALLHLGQLKASRLPNGDLLSLVSS